MKNLLFGLSVCFATLLSAQNYPNNGWGNGNNYNNNGYNNYDDEGYFPDDYYYEYPEDYYSNDYYRDFYNDYRQSLQMINWNRFFREYNLTRRQISLILDLNNQFNSFNVWNSYYRSNPQRWYYDRYFAIERILGPQVFVVFQNRYYDGFNPVVFYNNRCNTFYRNNFRVRPAYVNINVNVYRVNRQQYHQSVGNNFGWKQTRNTSNGFVEDGRRNGNYKNNNSGSNGFRNTNSGNTVAQNSVRNSSTRSDNGLQTVAQQPRTRNISSDVATSPTVQPRIRNTSTVEPRRNNSISTQNSNSSVRPERSSSTRSSGNSVRSSSSDFQRSSSTETRSSTGRR